ncbi:MAG: bifunctional 23S rRNA (guanine(2069)-N(7))-methyltransferase RlmK/23S rRNA (guanine(2445)-N(2))-methyltransferase RlmL [Pseudomonadota bacterium]
MDWFFPCPRGLEYLLVDELKGLGLQNVHERLAGVAAAGDLAAGYRAALGSRLASRVLLPLRSGLVEDGEALAALVRDIPWQDHLKATVTFAVSASLNRHPTLKDSRYAALLVKDGLCDVLRERKGARPSVDRENPDLSVYLHIGRDQRATLGIDLVGRPLHQRGYRRWAGEAPLKENLAAALVLRSGWLEDPSQPLVDPMCGAGTLLLEAVGMALRQAPGLAWISSIRRGWLGHQSSVLKREQKAAAELARDEASGSLGPVLGRDLATTAVRACREHAANAGLSRWVTFETADLGQAFAPTEQPGVVLTNPPYGRRLGGGEELADLYRLLGDRLRQDFAGWRASVFTEDPERCRSFGFPPEKRYQLYNGALACSLLRFQVPEAAGEPSEEARMVANRIRKNLKKVNKYLKNNNISAYRIYDRDIPEYAVAVDVYGPRINLQEYAPPASVPPPKAARRLADAITGVQLALEVEAADIVVRRRRRQRGSAQYERRGGSGRFHWVEEGPYRFAVNLTDYLDTGLFLDHRETRRLVGEWSAGKSVLNLYCYTGSFTVYAAGGGADHTTSVDVSRTYLDWCRRNLEANNLNTTNHRLLREDVQKFLTESRQQFDLIILDPPTFSNAAKAESTLDVQRDHGALLAQCRQRLAPGGSVLFSTNARKFRLDEDLAADWEIEVLKSVPPDFSRRPPHQAWRLRPQPSD